MKRLYLIFLLVFPTFLAAGEYIPRTVRIVQTVNRDWTFNYLPSGEEDLSVAGSAFDDRKWPAVAVPHTWMTYETTGDLHPYIMSASEREDPYWWNGWGWYRKRIVFGRELEGKRIFVEFDGVQKYAKVFLNGALLGDHKGGYGGFCFDLTPHVRFGEENLLCVEVSNRRDDRFGTIAPATAGNFNVYGGIYRDVRIVVKDPVHIPFQGSHLHEGGTFVTTPQVSEKEATVCVKTYVRIGMSVPREVTVRTVVTDSAGRVVLTLRSSRRVEPGRIAEFVQHGGPLVRPRLWSPQSPYLYTVWSEVYEGDRLTDTYRSPLGFRWFHWDYADNTLVVNGEKIHIHGTNRHQEYPWLGDAMPKWLTERDMTDIRYGMNTNFMRTAHYPHDPMVYDFNDRHGIITVEEVPNLKAIRYDRGTQEDNMREMVRRDRNHPSIFFWSVGNETTQAADSKWTYEEDTTRIIHERKTEMYGDYVSHHASNLDMENLLRVTIRGWYDKDVKNLEPRNNARVLKSGQLAGTEEWQHKMARVQDGSIRGRIDGNVLGWLYEDHGCDRLYTDSPLKNINYKGWVDLYRVPKYMYYLWQANYLPELMVFVQPHRWQRKYVGQRRTIQVDSNGESVELLVDGRSLGVKYPSKENFFTVEVPDVEIVPGELKAVAVRDGERVESRIEMAGEPARIMLKAERGVIPADRSGVDIIMADIVDDRGNHVLGVTAPLTWEVSGEGTLVGPGLYTSDMDKTLATEGTGYVVTPVPNVVRSTGRPGTITVRVSSPGVEPAEVTIRTEAVERAVGTGIYEPELSDEGRERVAKDTAFREVVKYVEEMKPIDSSEQIDADTPRQYADRMRGFVMERNPQIDSSCVEFRSLVKRLAGYVAGVKGELTEDDYNFIARTYNDVRMLARVVDSRNFHPAYAEELKKYYAETMLERGELTDVEGEVRMLEAIPREIDIVYIRRPKGTAADTIQYGNTTYRYSAYTSSLEGAVALLHPGFGKFGPQQREKVLDYLVKINPSLTRDGGKYRFRFDRPLAVPRKLE